MKKVLLAMSLSAAWMMAQPGAASAAPTFTEVKAALSLTDAQVTSLTQIRQAEAQAVQPIATQMQTKRQTLQTSLAGGTTALAAGTLLLEIEALRKQMETIETNARNQAIGVLSADQRTKLATLDAAAKLQPAIGQARALNLLAAPANTATGGPGGRFGGGPVGPGGPGGFGFGRPSPAQ